MGLRHTSTGLRRRSSGFLIRKHITVSCIINWSAMPNKYIVGIYRDLITVLVLVLALRALGECGVVGKGTTELAKVWPNSLCILNRDLVIPEIGHLTIKLNHRPIIIRVHRQVPNITRLSLHPHIRNLHKRPCNPHRIDPSSNQIHVKPSD